VFDVFTGTLQADGETLSLVEPGTNSASDLVLAKVRYLPGLPWTTNAPAPGASFQLIDPQQDNWRAGNWALANPSPGGSNSVLTALPPFPPLWINEVQADNLTGITNRAGQRSPWIELYNPTANTVSLAGLYLANTYTNLAAWTFPVGATIGPGAFEVIFADGQAALSTLAELHTSFTLPSGSGSVALSRSYNGQIQVLDFLDYAGLAQNYSYGSFPDGLAFDRQQFAYATPGATNNDASPPLSVRINEWMAANTHTLTNPLNAKFSDWFELYNYGTNPANLAGYFLTDNLTNEFQFEIPAGYTIAPHGFLLVWADGKATNGTPDLHVTFKMNKAGESLGLYAADGTPVDFVNYGPQTDDVSEGRYPDGATALFFMPTPTPDAPNEVPNTPPALGPLPDRVITLGQPLAFTVSATDTDQPPQTLTFALGPGSPPDATIDPGTGLFRWTPGNAPSTNSVTVFVTDNGTPALTASGTFSVTVLLPPSLTAAMLNGTQLTVSWPALAGQQYQVEYTDDLASSAWAPYGSPVTGTAAMITTTLDISNSQRFFRVSLK
jgi:hypothetical protein